MQISLRLSEEGKKRVSIVMTKVFTAERKVKVSIYPIPKFVKDPTCTCGKRADYFLEDFSMICRECLNTMLKSMSKIEDKKDLSIPLSEGMIKSLRFEWSTGNRWYTVLGKNLRPQNWKQFLKKFRTAIINNSSISVQGEYDKDTKIMTIY